MLGPRIDTATAIDIGGSRVTTPSGVKRAIRDSSRVIPARMCVRTTPRAMAESLVLDASAMVDLLVGSDHASSIEAHLHDSESMHQGISTPKSSPLLGGCTGRVG